MLPMNEQSEPRQKITHFNYAQQRAWIVNANILALIAGRGIGKDHGIITPAVLRNVKEMPRGATAFIAPTYVKAKGDLIPSLVKALEKFNFYEGVDFWIGEHIPKKVKHVKAYEHPRDPQYSVFFRNGHIIRLIGLDRKDTANGQSNDFIILNEAKFIREEDYKSRVVPTNRGNEDVPAFAKLHFHHGQYIISDMPSNAAGKWILKFEKEMDQEQIDLIVSFDHEQRQLVKTVADKLLGLDDEKEMIVFNDRQLGIIEDLKTGFTGESGNLSERIRFDKERLLATMRDLVKKGQLTEAIEIRFRKEITRLDNALFELRRDAIHFMKASTLENIDVLRESFIKQMSRVLTDRQFNTSILNLEDDGAEEEFYSTFNEDLHTYTDIDYDYLDQFKQYGDADAPWKKDADLDPTRPLHIGCDWNKAFTSMTIGQEFPHVFKIVNVLYVKDPQRIKHLAKLFADYYKGYPCAKVEHHYDHTAQFKNAQMEKDYSEDMHDELHALDWDVTDHYIGQALPHAAREKMFRRVYAEDDYRTKPIRINRTNCGDLITSVKNVENKEDRLGAHKDKGSERSKKIAPEHSIHLTDAHDTLYIGAFFDRLDSADYEPDFTT